MAISALNPKYDVLDDILESIYNECVKLDDTQREALVERSIKVLNAFQDQMKKDSKYFEVFNRIGYTGSYYDGVRVGEATEFDLNLILKPKLKMELSKHGCQPGFIAIKVDERSQDTEWFRNNWMSNGFLNPAKIRRWLEGIVTKATAAVNELAIDNCSVSFVKSGPAMTLKVESKTYPEISIDLVPVFEFSSSRWPFIPRKPRRLLGKSYDDNWFTVPKLSDSWRLSFPIQEREIINNRYYLKYTLRLLKKVRDELGINEVASYYIKSLFLWELEISSPEIWTRNRRGRLFMHMLGRFRDALGEGEILFYWEPKSNLIGGCSERALRNSYGKLNNFIKVIDRLIDKGDIPQLETFIRGKLYLPVIRNPRNGSQQAQQNGLNVSSQPQSESDQRTCTLQ